jgi:hypothetical protein
MTSAREQRFVVRATYELPRAIAIYAILHRTRQRVLQYRARERSLRLPAICRPPPLLERAVVLCSGLPPSFDPPAACLTYSDVPPDIARLAADLLRQPLT